MAPSRAATSPREIAGYLSVSSPTVSRFFTDDATWGTTGVLQVPSHRRTGETTHTSHTTRHSSLRRSESVRGLEAGLDRNHLSPRSVFRKADDHRIQDICQKGFSCSTSRAIHTIYIAPQPRLRRMEDAWLILQSSTASRRRRGPPHASTFECGVARVAGSLVSVTACPFRQPERGQHHRPTGIYTVFVTLPLCSVQKPSPIASRSSVREPLCSRLHEGATQGWRIEHDST